MRFNSEKEARDAADNYIVSHLIFMKQHGADDYLPDVRGYRWEDKIVLDSGGAGFTKDKDGVLHYYATFIGPETEEEYAKWRWEKVVPGGAIFICGYHFRSPAVQVVITSVDERWVTGNPYEEPTCRSEKWTPTNKVRRVGVPTLLKSTCKPHDAEDVEYFLTHGEDMLLTYKYGYISTPDLVEAP